VKITVIATGFERKTASRQAPAAAPMTPVDLNIYSAHLNPTVAEVSAAAAGGSRGRVVASAPDAPAMTLQAGGPPTVGVIRRPALDLSLSNVATGTGVSAGENVFEASSPLDVPAFLRRQT
jgi:hypothetical protein